MVDFAQHLKNPRPINLTDIVLFFDTETCGLPKNYKAPITDFANWPRLVQLATMAFDLNGKELSRFSALVKPEGFVISEDSTRIHGITTERAMEEGQPQRLVLEGFRRMVMASRIIVAHNMAFDSCIMGAELLREGLPATRPPQSRKICTMMETTDFCKLPRNKWPKLMELHRKLFGCDFEGAHDASFDVAATAKCFWELVRLGVIKI